MKTALYFASSVVAVSFLIGCSSNDQTVEFEPAESDQELKTVEDIHTTVADNKLNESSPAQLVTQSREPHVVLKSKKITIVRIISIWVSACGNSYSEIFKNF